MNTIPFKVIKNVIKKVGGYTMASSENNYTKFHFEFSDDWIKPGIQLSVTMFFDPDNIPDPVLMDMKEDGTAFCYIPNALKDESGQLYIGITGTYADNSGNQVTINTLLTSLNIGNGGYMVKYPANDVYINILYRISQCVKEIDKLYNSYDKHEKAIFSVRKKDVTKNGTTNNAYIQYTPNTKTLELKTSTAYTTIIIPVTSGEKYYIEGYHNNPFSPAWLVVDKNDVVIQKDDDTSNTGSIKECDVVIGDNSAKLYVSTKNSVKEVKIEKYASVNTIAQNTETIAQNTETIAQNTKTIAQTKEKIDNLSYENDILSKKVLSLSMRDPFEYKPFEKGYVIFCVDDANIEHLDKIASIFESKNIPLCLAVPQKANIGSTIDKLPQICTGLTEQVGSYTVGMSVKEVCQKVVELGGEILSHSWTPVKSSNINDYDFMYDTFVNSKKNLENNGFEVRGIITTGGTGMIDVATNKEYGDILQYWASKYYDYSDQYGNGETEDYYHKRYNLMGRTLEKIQEYLYNNVVKNKKFVVLYFHKLIDTDVSETTLNSVLDYCLSQVETGTMEITTYQNLYDTMKSTKLNNEIISIKNSMTTNI